MEEEFSQRFKFLLKQQLWLYLAKRDAWHLQEVIEGKYWEGKLFWATWMLCLILLPLMLSPSDPEITRIYVLLGLISATGAVYSLVEKSARNLQLMRKHFLMLCQTELDKVTFTKLEHAALWSGTEFDESKKDWEYEFSHLGAYTRAKLVIAGLLGDEIKVPFY